MMPLRSYKLHNEGFTLVELLIAIGLIALVTVVAIPNFRQLSKDQDLDNSAAQLVNILRKAQSSAASHIKCPTNDEASTNWSVVLSLYDYKLKSQCKTQANNPTVYTNKYGPAPDSPSANWAISSACPTNEILTIYFSNGQMTYQCASSPVPLAITSNITITLSNASGALKTVVIEPGGTIR